MPEPLRVLYVDNTFTFGGAFESLSLLVSGLGERVAAVVITGQPEEVARAHFPGVPVECWKLRLPWITPDPIAGDPTDERLQGLTRAQRLARSAWWLFTSTLPTAIRIAGVGRRHGTELVHLNNLAEAQPEGLLAAKLLGVPCVAHCRGHADAGLRSARLLASVPDHHIAISGSVRDALLAAGVPDDHVTVVSNGVDLERFEPGPAPPGRRDALGVPGDAVLVGHVGRIVPWKGQLEFLEAFARAAGRIPTVHALVVGDRSDGQEAYERAVVARAGRPDLAGRVTLVGFRPDIADLMRTCDVLMHSSTSPEPFGRVLIEAMALGIPVVAAASGGPLEIVEDGVTGRLVDPGDADTAGGVLVALLRDAELRGRMGRAAAHRARKLFSRDAHTAGVAGVYDRVLRRRGFTRTWRSAC
ncbi:MAG TPA: glycosyltransferase family 4 protein [Longimicrobiales bacterium]|nr:glycosyltransferase family 4 protein [Longimicrobiales bacterium]